MHLSFSSGSSAESQPNTRQMDSESEPYLALDRTVTNLSRAIWPDSECQPATTKYADGEAN